MNAAKVKKFKMWGIRDKRTGLLLVADSEVNEYYDYVIPYGDEEIDNKFHRVLTHIRVGECGGQVFVTTNESDVDELLKPDPNADKYFRERRLRVPEGRIPDLEKVRVHCCT